MLLAQAMEGMDQVLQGEKTIENFKTKEMKSGSLMSVVKSLGKYIYIFGLIYPKNETFTHTRNAYLAFFKFF